MRVLDWECRPISHVYFGIEAVTGLCQRPSLLQACTAGSSLDDEDLIQSPACMKTADKLSTDGDSLNCLLRAQILDTTSL